MGYWKSLLLALLFFAGIAGWAEGQALLFPFLGIGITREWTKLLTAPGFLIGSGVVALVARRFLPRAGQPDIRAIPALITFPFALNLAAIPLYNLSLILVPPGDLFFEMQRIFEPTGTLPDTLGIILSVVIIGPLCEEFVFRGIILEGLFQSRKNLHIAVWLQALLFGAAHANPWQFFYAFLIGALFGYLRLWTGGIGLTSGIHSLVNLTSMASYWVDLDRFTGPPDGSLVDIHPVWPTLGLAIILAGSLPLFLRYRKSLALPDDQFFA